MIEVLFCLVVGVTDGDTLKARCGTEGYYNEVKVRLIAIDAPERKQPFGLRSKQALSDICYEVDAKITIHYSDRWGRKVADVECNGVNASSHLVKLGFAWVYPQFAKKHRYLYPLEREARRIKIGLWRDKEPVPPWEWRKGVRR